MLTSRRQADLAQVAAVLLVVAPARQAGRGARIDKGEEVSAVIDQRAQVQAQLLDQALGELLLDGLDIGLGNPFHVVPEGLAGELVGGGWQEAGQDGAVIPAGQFSLAGGAGSAVDGGQHQVLADREALVGLGQLGVDELDQAQLLGLVPEGGDVAEAGGAGALWGDRFLGGGDGLEDMFEGAEVGRFDDFGFAVDALALAGVVVGAAVDGLGGEGGHYVRSYNCWYVVGYRATIHSSLTIAHIHGHLSTEKMRENGQEVGTAGYI